MLAREIMTSPVVTAHPDLPIKAAVRLLDRHDITAVPVIDDRQRLIGIVSEADLLPGQLVDGPRSRMDNAPRTDVSAPETVSEVMTLGVITVQEATDASSVAQLMLGTGAKSIPVVRGTKVVGIVSRRDLIHPMLASVTSADVERPAPANRR
jgi:CBS domain-containing protein